MRCLETEQGGHRCHAHEARRSAHRDRLRRPVLTSDKSSYSTGAEPVIDGGCLAAVAHPQDLHPTSQELKIRRRRAAVSIIRLVALPSPNRPPILPRPRSCPTCSDGRGSFSDGKAIL